MFTKKIMGITLLCIVLSNAQMYNITISSGPGGTTYPNGTMSVSRGNYYMLALPDSGYLFKKWTISGGGSWFGDTFDIVGAASVESNMTYTANFITGGVIYDINNIDTVFNFTKHSYDGDIEHSPGVVFRFLPPAAGAYTIKVMDVEPSIVKKFFYHGKDPTLRDELDTNGIGTLKRTIMASEANVPHYFSIYNELLFDGEGVHLYDADNDFIIRYEPAALVRVEDGTIGRYEIPVDYPVAVTIGEKNKIEWKAKISLGKKFDHWELVSGDAVFESTTSTYSSVVVYSEEAVLRAISTLHSDIDTLIIRKNNGSMIMWSDTMFTYKYMDTLVTAVADVGYRFNSWAVVEGNSTLENPLQQQTRVDVAEGKTVLQANFTPDKSFIPSVAINDIDISGHPGICVTASVTDNEGKSISGLDASRFMLYEDGTMQSFNMREINVGGGTSVCLVIGRYHLRPLEVFIAMAKEYIASMGPGDRCAVVAYGVYADLVQEMTSDTVALNRAVSGIIRANSMECTPGLQLGVEQLVNESNERAIIHIGSSFGSNKAFTYARSLNDVIDYARNNNVHIYAFGGIGSTENEALVQSTGGFYINGFQYKNREKISDYFNVIKKQVESRYILCYETPDTIFNGDTHEVVVTVNPNGSVARDTTWWDESNHPPEITLTTATQALINKRQNADTVLTISADVTDDGTVADVTLYCRTTGSNDEFTALPMTLLSGNVYQTALLSEIVQIPGVDFYITAIDALNLIGRSPKILDPGTDPWVIFVGDDENMPPIITLTPSTLVLFNTSQKENSTFTITALINDDGLVTEVKLFYRTSGDDGVYAETTMTLQSGNTYEGTIPADIVLSPGVDFYIMATDDKELVSKSPNIPESGPWVIPVEKEPVTEIQIVKTAACFADNGFGRVNRIEMYYCKAIASDALPDSIRICWPDNNECQMVQNSSIAFDESNSTHLTVTLPELFPEGVTRFNEWNGILGTVYQKDSLGEEMASSFAIADSVGPLIASAQFVERLTAGNDTLIIEFTEYVDYKTLKESSLTLIKDDGQGTFTNVPLTISNAYPDNNGKSIVAIVSFTDETSAPKAGDSLRINAEGPITDEFGNHAHTLNRPVVLSVKRYPPEILQAVYEDRDADGMVDTVRVIFSRTVSLDAMEVKIEWNGTEGGATMSHYSRVGSGSGGDTIDVSIKAPLFFENTMKDRTSGNMLLTVRFTDYDESEGVKQALVSDGAAPVLTVMRYHFGQYFDDGLSSPDTLFAQFSEPLAEMPSAKEPFLFCSGDRTNYHLYVRSPTTVSLDTAGNGNWENYYRFLVTEVTTDQEPTPGNFGWINKAITNNIIDANGNVQTNERNRKVPVYLKLPQLHLKLQAGPVPFNPIDGDEFTIRITGNDKLPGTTEYRVRAFIYDMMGSVVKRFPEDFRNSPALNEYCSRVNGRVVKDGANWYLVTTDSTRILWDGTNRQHRIVGKGTYMVVPQIYYTTSGNTTVEYPSERILVGVKR